VAAIYSILFAEIMVVLDDLQLFFYKSKILLRLAKKHKRYKDAKEAQRQKQESNTKKKTNRRKKHSSKA
jgi:hypothetical protein